jgi:uncharacterized membrane protein
MVKKVLLIMVFIMVASIASGEYYKYIDKNGEVCFTDDISIIPKEQREGLKKMGSDRKETRAVEAAPEQKKITNPIPLPKTGKNADNIAPLTAEELNAMQTKLQETHRAIEKEKVELETQRPKEDVKSDEQRIFSTRVEGLNIKISEYEKNAKAFLEHVERFNAAKKINRKTMVENDTKK